jgi:hypothetical protein
VEGFPESEPITPHELLAWSATSWSRRRSKTPSPPPRMRTRARAHRRRSGQRPGDAGSRPILESKGVFVIPDILCNAGGVTVSYFEWVQDEQHLFWEAQDIYNRLERVMKTAFRDVLKIHLERKVPMRIAANMLASAATI